MTLIAKLPFAFRMMCGTCLFTFALQPLTSPAAANGSITIEREVLLARGNGGTPNVITRASDGSLIAAGSTGAAWAARVNASGALLWEYRDTRDESLGGPSQSQFNGAMVLADNSTLLCGFKDISKTRVGLVTKIDQNGRLTDQRLIRPNGDQKYGFTTITRCLRWGDGFALIGRSDSLEEGNTGWLVKLDALGKQEWEKIGQDVGGDDAVETAGHDLLITIQVGNPLGVKLVRLDPSGETVATRVIPCTAHVLFRSGVQSHTAQLAVIDWPKVMMYSLKRDLSDAAPPRAIESILAESGYALPDQSLVLFGKVQKDGDAFTAAIGRVSASGRLTNVHVFEPFFASDSVRDAVPLSPIEFVSVRDYISQDKEKRGIALSWVSIKNP